MREQTWGLHLAIVTVATAAYLLVPDPDVQGVTWMAIGWAPVLAIVTGVVLHRPARRGPWWLMAAGLGASAVAWVLAPASQDLTSADVQGSVADVLHLVCTLMIGAAALWFARLQTPDDDRNSVIDGVIVAVAVATVLWSAAIDPAALGANASASGRVVLVLAPVLPAGITAVCVRLLFTPGGRLAASRLLCGAWILSTLGSVAWILLLQADAFAPGGLTDVLWAAALGCAGASALHPSMTELSTPTTATHRAESHGRLVVLGVALLATPLALLTAVGVDQVHVVVPVAGAGVIALLVLVRLARLVHEREQARHELEVRAARQDVVARLGEMALGARPIASVHEEAAHLVAGVLDDVQVTTQSAEGPRLHVETTVGRALSPDERTFLTSVMAVLSGLAARRRAEDDLRQRALYDALTGLPNRVLVQERLAQAVRQRDRGPVGALFVDLDGFKPVNDEHGHETGDALLAVVAARLPAVLRAGDTVGRFAGDEFVVVAPSCDEAGLVELAGRLVTAVGEPVEVGDVVVSVSASVGAAIALDGDHDARALLRRADAAMYEAKAAGGGTVAPGACLTLTARDVPA